MFRAAAQAFPFSDHCIILIFWESYMNNILKIRENEIRELRGLKYSPFYIISFWSGKKSRHAYNIKNNRTLIWLVDQKQYQKNIFNL